VDFFGQVNVFRININAGGLEIFVERQSLVNFTGHNQGGVAVQSAEVRVEILGVPLETVPLLSSR